MKLVVNSENEIISYVKTGNLSGSIEFFGVIPDDFEDNFRYAYYSLKENKIIKNPICS